MLDSLQIILMYLLEEEYEDFRENPARDHVYYHALIVQEGEISAQNALQMALAELNKEDK